MKKIITFSVFMLLFVCNSNSAILYVDNNATGANNGASWTDAFTNLSTAIVAAQNDDHIWVKASSVHYRPPANSAFDLRGKDLQIYGGFAGNETRIQDRNWRENSSILEMNVNQNYLMWLNNSEAVLDGFIITGGSATGGSQGNGNSYILMLGGHKNQYLSNLIFKDCHANWAILYSEGTPQTTTTKLFNVEISNNTFTPANSGLITYSNSSYLIRSYSATWELNNVTVASNNFPFPFNLYPAIHMWNSDLYIYNSIIYKTGAIVNYNNSSTITVANSLIEGTGGSGSAWWVANNITDSGNNIDANPMFVNNMNNYRLQPTSPAIDGGNFIAYAGSYTLAPQGLDLYPYDLDAKERYYIDSNWGFHIDMGAYQYQQPGASAAMRTAQQTGRMQAYIEQAQQRYMAMQQSNAQQRVNMQRQNSDTPSDIRVYPSPVRQGGTLHIQTATDNCTIRIFALNGACVYTGKADTYHSAVTAPGSPAIYIVTVTDGDNNTLYSGKIIVTE